MADDTLLSTAVAKLDVETVRRLISQGADCNFVFHTKTPLNFLCTISTSYNPKDTYDGIETIFTLLVEGGADVFYRRELDGLYMHWISAENGNVKMCELLLEKIPKDSLEMYTMSLTGASSLYVAAQNGHVGVVKHCLENGFDPNNTTVYGMTPLMTAVLDVKKRGHQKKVLEIVKLLIRRGANLLAEYQGKSILELTKDDFYKVIAELILAYTMQNHEVSYTYVKEFVDELPTSSNGNQHYKIFRLLLVNKMNTFIASSCDCKTQAMVETIKLLLAAGFKNKFNERCCSEDALIRIGIVEVMKCCILEETSFEMKCFVEIFFSLPICAKSLFFRWVEGSLRAEQALFSSLFDETCDDETSFQTEVFGPVAEEIAAMVVYPKAVVRKKLRFLERNKWFFFD